MVYKTHHPVRPLAPYIEFFWFFDGLFPSYSLERVLPQGSFELVIDLREIPRRLFANDDQTRWREYRRAWISGVHSRFIVIDVLPDSSMIGAHFRPGGAAPFLGMPADKLSDRVEEIDQIWGSEGLRLRDSLMEGGTVEIKFSILEQFLLGRLAQARCETSVVDIAVQQLVARPQAASISRMAGQFGLSHKHFIAQFRNRVGMAPKRFCRIRRFQGALSEIEAQKSLDWAGIASDAGYFDQAHFINDFIAFSGLNPSSYLTDRGEFINYVPMHTR